MSDLRAAVEGLPLYPPNDEPRATTLADAAASMRRRAAALIPEGALLVTEEPFEWDEQRWEAEIIKWLGPQRMSIEQPRATKGYARGALMAAAILRHLREGT